MEKQRLERCPKFSGPLVEALNITKKFGKKTVLNEISFSINRGSIWAIIGPNGSGKTTTLRIIAGLMGWDKGQLRIFGKNISPHNYPTYVRKHISYLPEEAGVYERLTGWENLLFYAMIYSNSKDEAMKIAEKGAAISGLGKELNRKAGEYSKGMKRRLLLARALMTEPCLAILDEPTSGLDVFSSLAVREIIKRFAFQGGTVIISSHDMLEIQHISDEVAFIHRGKIVEKGRPEALLKKHHVSTLEEVYVAVAQGDSNKMGRHDDT